MAEVSRYDEMTAIVAARLVASDLGVEPLDDRILIAFRDVILPAHGKAVREQVALDIEAVVAGEMSHDIGDVIRSAFREAASIARGVGVGS